MDYLDFYAGAFITSKDGPLCQYEPSDDMCHYSRKNYFQNTIFVSHANTKGSKIDVEIAVIFHTGKLKGYLVKFETVKEFISTYFPNSKIQKRSPEKLFFLVPSLKNENYCLKKQIAAIEAKNINHLIQLKKKYTATVENVRAEYNRFLEKEGAASKDITNIHNYICPVYRLTIDEEHELKKLVEKGEEEQEEFFDKILAEQQAEDIARMEERMFETQYEVISKEWYDAAYENEPKLDIDYDEPYEEEPTV